MPSNISTTLCICVGVQLINFSGVIILFIIFSALVNSSIVFLVKGFVVVIALPVSSRGTCLNKRGAVPGPSTATLGTVPKIVSPYDMNLAWLSAYFANASATSVVKKSNFTFPYCLAILLNLSMPPATSAAVSLYPNQSAPSTSCLFK